LKLVGHFKVPIIFIPNVVDVGVYLDWTPQVFTRIPEEDRVAFRLNKS